ncbi:MFS transporter [Nocardioides jejuensis]|uniref:NarK/NasA family nitrate transporter n=1 Tax=Nocardioides jejuensis TaxID=2502782 RepID=A0A4R1CG36_9ACTN|nr:nitrate/nitrite transporter [Nocardioides jejuensis]TCJ30294.1 NarK/NasA family nitrate transporter [Nocardioides jejuensis]
MTPTLAAPPQIPSTAPAGGTWIDEWHPEDDGYWEAVGREVARRNLACSIFAEHVGFSVWLLFSVLAAYLPFQGFDFSVSQLFLLVALPNLVGALLRLPYTFLLGRLGGRNWATIKTSLLLLPTLSFAYFVQHPGTPYAVFVGIALLVGLGGGGFASSMANINFFFPASAKGIALGLNAAGGNLGGAVMQFVVPMVVGAGGCFGLVKGGVLHLQVAAYLYAGLAAVAAFLAFRNMNNLRDAKSSPKAVLALFGHKHTWVMSLLYIGTFGSFIGYAAAMPLLIRLNFAVIDPQTAQITGIHFAWYAFIGALVGALFRPVGGWLADRFGGARVTLWAFVAMILGTLGVLATLAQVTPNPAKDPAIALGNQHLFVWFLLSFTFIFAATGVGNGSTYRMIPLIWRHKHTADAETSAEHEAGVVRATKEASAVIGIAGAVGALGGFLIPMAFGAPWVSDPFAAVRTAFIVFAGYYVFCLVLTWFEFTRKHLFTDRIPSLAHARI